MIVWRDGAFLDEAQAVSTEDRGWLVGDAIFETMLVDKGRPAFLSEHLTRLSSGLAVMKMKFAADEARLRSVVAGLAERNGVAGSAAFRLTLSRVGGGRGISIDETATVQATATLKSVAPPLSRWRAVFSTRRRWTGAATNAFKCVGAYSQNVLARAEANALGADEAIMLNEHDRVACAGAANVFVLSADGLITPSLAEGAMPGVVRGVLIREARRLGVRVVEGEVDQSSAATGLLLLTNSIVGVVEATVGDDPRGDLEIADALRRAYGAKLSEELSGDGRGALT